MRLALAPSLLALALGAGGCGERAEIVLGLDATLPAALADRYWIRAAVDQPTCTALEAAMAPRPITLGLVGSPGEALRVDVAALPPGAPSPPCRRGPPAAASVHQAAEARFVEGRRLLWMTLRESCAGVSCAAGETCVDGGCAPVDRGALPSFEGGFPPRADAGAGGDAGPPRDAASPDAGLDAGAPCPPGSTSTRVLLGAMADTLITDTPCAEDCGGAVTRGDLPNAAIGIGRGLFRFGPLPPGATEGWSRRAGRVEITFSRETTTCRDGCRATADLAVLPLRDDWVAGAGAQRDGANWCLRRPRSGATCPGDDSWGMEGASGAVDVNAGGAAVQRVDADAESFTVSLPTSAFDPFVDSGTDGLAVQLRVEVEPEPPTNVFNAATAEALDRARRPVATLWFCE